MLFYNLRLSKLSILSNSTKETNLLFANERYPEKNIISTSIQHSSFYNIGFKNTTFTCCDFKYNVFKDVYFKNSTFETVSFVGVTFINCNFSETTFISCDFRYATFTNCFIDYSALKPNLPSELNLRKNLCKNLTLANLACGNTSQFREYFYEERRSSRKYYLKIAFCPDNYMKKKYDSLSRLKSAFKAFFDFLNSAFWGYGESLGRLVTNIIILNIIYFVIFLLKKENNTFTRFSPEHIKNTAFTSIGYFFNFLSPQPNETTYFILIYKVIGVIFVGFFIACLFRRSNKR